jgi:pyruvate,orthophosphate dikinase
MPGMMEWITDIGLNDPVAEGMVALTEDERYVYNLYRMLIYRFGSSVLGPPDEGFERAIAASERRTGVEPGGKLGAEDLRALSEEFKATITRQKGVGFPQEPLEQIRLATEAVFRHWNSAGAIAYRNREGIAHDLGSGACFMSWVFGNMSEDSGIGEVYTRDPGSGDRVLQGEYMLNAHGWDWMDRLRPTHPISMLEQQLPGVYAQLVDACAILEDHYREMQRIEFRIERGRLRVLHSSNARMRV